MKRNAVLLLILFMLVFDVNAQLTRDLSSFSLLKSPNQQIIEKVVNSGVFILKQSYELADSLDNRYGLSGNKAFDTDYTLAIKIKNGFIISERAIYPWDFNEEFDKYRGSYSPKLYSTQFSEVGSKCRYDSILINGKELKSLCSGMLYAQESEQFFGDGFSLGGNLGDNDGWIVWFTKKKSLDLERETDLNLSIVQKKLNISSRDSNSYFYPIDSLITSDEIMGGIFVIPEIISVGHLELKLCGVVCRIENGWMLCCPFVTQKEFFSSKDVDLLISNNSESDEPKLTINKKADNCKSLSKKEKSKRGK